MKYKKGNLVNCTVTGIQDYGVFVDLDEYYKGLIHISEISDNYIRDINAYVKVGQKINAKVIESDEKTGKVKLTIKNIDLKQQLRGRGKIKETNNGFNGLKEKMSIWITQKLTNMK